MKIITGLEKRVVQHRGKSRGERDPKIETDPVRLQAPENIQKGQINFGDRFKKPVLFKAFRHLGMPDKRKVTVKKQTERSR